MDAVIAALDVGGTAIKAALVDRRGALSEPRRRPTNVDQGPAAVVAGILAFAQELAEDPGAEVVGIGICVPGLVDPVAGIVRKAVNLGWDHVPLARLLEERTGLHELEFIEVRRHWFTEPVQHDTAGTVNVLNLVEGAQAVVTSPTGAFEPYVVHYAETFVVPASVGPYTITPYGTSVGQRLGTVKAYVRGTATTSMGSGDADVS